MKPGNAFRLGVTLYSFNAEFYSYKYSFEECMEKASSLGEGQGVEIVGPQMIRSFPELSEEFERQFKRLVDRYGLRPSAYGAYADPQRITGRLLTRSEQIDYLKLQLQAAQRLGFPVIRVQAVEPVFSDLVPYAEKLGVKMGIEIHSPMKIEEMDKTITRVEQVGSEYLGFIPDCGAFCHSCAKVYVERFLQLGVPRNFVERILQRWKERMPAEAIISEVKAMGGDDLAQMMAMESCIYFGHSDPSSLKRIMPYIVHVHGKFFGIDEMGIESAVRFPEVVRILKAGGFSGYMSCEYEGHHWLHDGDAFSQIQSLQKLIREQLGTSAETKMA